MTDGQTPSFHNHLKSGWNDGRAGVGLWLTGEGVSSAEALGAAGFDYIAIDLQHGLIDDAGALAMLRALVASPSTLLCRVPWNEPGIIGRVLDFGAQGVIIPMVDDADDARRAVAACRYAPDGGRSYGPARVRRLHGTVAPADANAAVACIPMIETTEAVGNLDEILAVPGIDAVYVGPSDLSITMGLAPAGDQSDVRFTDALAAVLDGCTSRGIVAGIHANTAVASKRLEQGFRMVTVTTDVDALLLGAATALDSVVDAR